MAREMLGKVLLSATPQGLMGGKVVEAEAYLGLEDPASHIGRGLTARTQGIFGQPGMVYVYFIYGMHHCVNAVTLSRPPYGAVLLRALEPLDHLKGFPRMGVRPPGGPTNGPGLLTRAMGIDLSHNRGDFTQGPLYLLDLGLDCGPMGAARRVGISRASELPLRYYISGNPHLSSPRPG